MIRPRRVLMVTYDFPPAMVVGAQACAQIARYLPAYGWEPVVLTVRERYITRLDGDDSNTFPGIIIRTGVLPHPLQLYRWLKKALMLERVTTTTTAGSSSREGVIRRWVLSLLTAPDDYTGWIFPALLSGLGVIKSRRVNCILSSGPWWTNHLVGLGLAKMTGVRWVAHFRDPWINADWIKPVSAISVRIERALERMVVHTAQAVICVTEEHTRLLQDAYPEMPPTKFITIPNGYDGMEWEAVSAHSDGASPVSADRFVITYAGDLYDRRNPLPLLRALRSLIDMGEITAERIRVDLIGDCQVAEGARVAEMVAQYGLLGCVNITGPLSRAETLRRVARSNLLLLLAEGLTSQIPGKTYEYLRAGRPILALTSSGAVADFLQKTGGAWIVEPTDLPRLAATLLGVYRSWQNRKDGPRPDPAIVASFDRRLLAGLFAAIFDAGIADFPPTDGHPILPDLARQHEHAP